MFDKNELAVKKFKSGYNCAQSVLFALTYRDQISENTLLKIATGFGAGMGREQKVCGALSGGIMSLGLKYGRGIDDTSDNTQLTYQKTRELIAQFEDKFGSAECCQLLGGIDLKTEEGQKQFKEKNLLEKTCVNCVKYVVECCLKL